MKIFRLFIGLAVIISIMLPLATADTGGNEKPFTITSVPRQMSYQGILKDSAGDPVTDSVYNVTFRIYNVESGGTFLWDETLPCTTSAGYFTAIFSNVNLPFDEDYWLELEVDSEILDPRQKIGMVGYAAVSDTSDASLDIIDNAVTSPKIQDGSIQFGDIGPNGAAEGQVMKMQGGNWTAADDESGTGYWNVSDSILYTNNLWGLSRGGAGNAAYDDSVHTIVNWGVACTTGIYLFGTHAVTIGGGIGNVATDDYSTVSGGKGNRAIKRGSTIGGGEKNEVIDIYATICGGLENQISGNYATGSVICGGLNDTIAGQVAVIGGGSGNVINGEGDYGVIAGGQDNLLDARDAVIGGGLDNEIFTDADYSTIAGGVRNEINAWYATVGGGSYNDVLGRQSGVFCGNSNAAGDAAEDTCAFVGGGAGNDALSKYSVISGGRSNSVEGDYSCIVGGQYDTTNGIWSAALSGYSNIAGDDVGDSAAFVGGGYNNSALGDFSTIGGGYGNIAEGPYSVIAGGGGPTGMMPNKTLDFHCTVAGGRGNEAHGSISTVAGGKDNMAIGDYSFVGGGDYNEARGRYSAVGGGRQNIADTTGGMGTGEYATIGGGTMNSTKGDYSTIAGGRFNNATGEGATIPGGYWNIASGSNSFAAGYKAAALHKGTFVWSDSSGDIFSSNSDNQFLIRAAGGMGLGTSSPGGQFHVTTGKKYAGIFTSDSLSASTHVIHAEYAGSGNYDARAVYGKAVPADYYGYGGYFEGGYYGVYGKVDPTGNNVYTGTLGRALSDSGGGTRRGIYGSAGGTGTNYGVYGYRSTVYGGTGYGVYYSGGLAGSGSKSCIVKTSQGPTLLYCQESPENWFEDFGEGRLENGQTHIELDPLFLETVTINDNHPMKVFVQLKGDCNGVYVQDGTTGFDVIELQKGTSNAPFTYRIVAKRKGFENERLEYTKAGESDPYLYPERAEKQEIK